MGNSILYPQSYRSATPRDNRIITVIKNGLDKFKYEKSDKNADFSFIFKAGNRQKIAKSLSFASAVERDHAMIWEVKNMSVIVKKYGITYDSKAIIIKNA